jgi:ADP-ribose pyrophosphatase YjhB (NUDIX family)
MRSKKTTWITQSAGVAITWNKSILLVHPTNASWKNALSIPKGMLDEGEDVMAGAIRELKEETGIAIKKTDLGADPQTMVINYERNGKIYKQLTVFFLYVNDEIKTKLQIADKIPKQNLQLAEIDWAGFIPLSEVENKIMPRLMPVVSAILAKNHALT